MEMSEIMISVDINENIDGIWWNNQIRHTHTRTSVITMGLVDTSD